MILKIRKYTKTIIFRIVIGVLACILGVFLLKEYITLPILQSIFSSNEITNGIQNLLSGLILVLIYCGIYKVLENRKIQELSLNSIVYDTLLGLGLGFGLISLIIALLYFMGYYEITAFKDPKVVVLPLTILISAALLEELVFRGIIYRILEERFGTKIALLQAVVFGIVHYFNENATSTSVLFVVLLGVVLSLLYTYTKRLWLPFFFHLSWNFAQVIYGTPLSGDEGFKALVLSEFKGPDFFIGSAFGLEDSFFSIFFMTLLAFVIYWLCKKNTSLVRYPIKE